MRVYSKWRMILDLSVEETDDGRLVVWFTLKSKDNSQSYQEWLERNCEEDYKWKFVPGSAVRRVTFNRRGDASNFVVHLMHTRTNT